MEHLLRRGEGKGLREYVKVVTVRWIKLHQDCYSFNLGPDAKTDRLNVPTIPVGTWCSLYVSGQLFISSIQVYCTKFIYWKGHEIGPWTFVRTQVLRNNIVGHITYFKVSEMGE